MKRLILIITALISMTGLILPQMAFAACPTANDQTSSKNQVLVGTGAAGNDCNGGAVQSIVSEAVTILSYVAGVVAVIMIIVSGFRYITSGGDSGRVASAKNTLIYAAVGIAVAVLAQLLVNLVITQSTTATKACPPGQHVDSSNNCVDNKKS